ncbi:hypothetical protein Mp_8g01070 [Marchantia polymorpha subsp. ruderalis]|uniref:Uncharacterized protein n=1 Tax=Marchantia polymorpha TaxID=3197 RepID=A0A2R6WRG6_MARPO|nr:hypothetical protein MARPO_0064s0091 [Marchantia polymorpha]BBN18259.1 hypothetical protein Mp_8g01070 [Marchantia polymorpha subsp. ruderalis]|eukprot:PTQ36414.1 hypothetical protein MARPO_0064s0091 [Marchantia polymorpha]
MHAAASSKRLVIKSRTRPAFFVPLPTSGLATEETNCIGSQWTRVQSGPALGRSVLPFSLRRHPADATTPAA